MEIPSEVSTAKSQIDVSEAQVTEGVAIETGHSYDESEDAQFWTRSSPASSALSLPGRLKLLLRSCLLIGLTLPLLAFGGVHEFWYLSSEFLFFLGAAVVLLLYWKEVRSAFWSYTGRVPVGVQALYLGLVLCAYFLVQNLALEFTSYTHPILGESSSSVPWWSFFDSLRGFGVFFAVFFLTTVYCSFSFGRVRWARTLLIRLTYVVSLIALSHWLYDNGKLFWVFEPNFVGESSRARWPFVNPNHLGHFCLLMLFVFLAEIEVRAREFSRELLRRRSKSFADVLRFQDLQLAVARIGFLSLGILMLGLCVAGTLSRSTWIGTSVGVLLYLVIGKFVLREPSRDESSYIRARKRHSKRSAYSGYRSTVKPYEPAVVLSYARRIFRPLLLVASMYVFLFFLNERGQQLVESRLEYAVAHSFDDIRWIMYSDTLEMIMENPVLGVGLGNWEPRYFEFMDSRLSGVNPEYAHSDPLQLLAEGGLLVTLPLLVLLGFTIIQVFRALRLRFSGRYFHTQIRMLGLFCSIFAFGAASLFDFPFHIPALVYVLAACSALMLAQVEMLVISHNRARSAASRSIARDEEPSLSGNEVAP